MHSFNFAKNVGAYTAVFPLGGTTSLFNDLLSTGTLSTVATGWYNLSTQTASTVVGAQVSGLSLNYQSAKACCIFHYLLEATQTMTISLNLQDATSSTGAGAADFGSTANQTKTVGSLTSTIALENVGIIEYDVDLTEANEFIRAQVSVAFSTEGTSAASKVISALPFLVLGGSPTLSAT